MLRHLTIDDFKIFRHEELPIAPINVLIGPNGSGKSTILHVLAVLKQSLGKTGLETHGPLIDLGDFESLLNINSDDDKIGFGLSFELQPERGLHLLVPVNGEYRARFYERGVWDHFLSTQGMLSVTGSRSFDGSVDITPRQPQFKGTTFNLQGKLTVATPLEVASRSGTKPDPDVQFAVGEELEAANIQLNRFYLVPAIRGFLRESYPLADRPTPDMLSAPTVEDQSSQVLSTLAYNPDLQDALSDFVYRAIGVRLRIRLVSGKRVAAEAFEQGPINAVNLGFGANQLIGVLAQILVSENGSLLGLEEAEIHVHPQAQAALASILVELAKGQAKQLLLTTHSEHLLMGLLTEVARRRLDPRDLNVFFLTIAERDGRHIEQLEVDERGRLAGGLKGFFEANLKELEDYFGASSKQ